MSVPEWKPGNFGGEPGGSSSGDFPGRSILNRASPMDVLEGLFEGDPLSVHPGACRRVEERCLLLDQHKVSKRSFARVARAGPLYRGVPPLEEWLRARYDHSIREILDEDVEDELQGMPVDRKEPRIQLLARNFGLEAGRARRACIRFNGLPLRVRTAFFEVNLRGRTAMDYGFSVDATYDQVLDDLENALRALSGPRDPFDLDLPDFSDPSW